MLQRKGDRVNTVNDADADADADANDDDDDDDDDDHHHHHRTQLAHTMQIPRHECPPECDS